MADLNNPGSLGNHQLDHNDLIAAARKLWGKETARHKTEWRFGTHGSKSIKLDDLVWFDHEEGHGGGVVDLCEQAGINGNYHKPFSPAGTAKAKAPLVASARTPKDNWQPNLEPPVRAPINMLGCDKLFTYRCAAGNPTHYVRRFEKPERKFLPLTYGTLNGAKGWHLKAPLPPLPLYRLEDLRELDPELVLLVEGEKACDAANAKIAAEGLSWLAMSWYGGAKRAKDADVLPLAGRRVLIWPDADKPGLDARDILLAMIAGAEALNVDGLADKFDAADLQSEDKIEEWVKARMKAPNPQPGSGQNTPPPPPPPGVSTGPAAAGLPPAGTASQPLPPDISIDDFYAYLPKHWYLYVPTQTLWPPATIGARLGKVGNVKAARWLDKERAVSQMIWAPGEPQIVKDKHLIEGGWIDKPGAIVFNQYRSGTVTGGDPALAGPWIDLVKYLWPTPMEHEHIITVLAHKIQHPSIKINHVLVLGGNMRIGKDTILVPIKQILGEWNCVEAKPTTIMSNFNGYMRSILLMINEARDLGDVKRHEFYLHMKDVIVTPPNTVLVNEKHEKGIHVANVCLVIMTTNHRTDGIYLPPDDGRHFPVWSDRVREDYDIDFFDRFYDWLENGGSAHVAAYLRSLDVSAFRTGRPPPQTALFHEIVAASTPIEVGWIQDVLDDAQWHPAVFILQSLIERAGGNVELREWLQNPGNRNTIPYRLERCGYTRVRNPDHGEGRWKIDGKFQNVYGNKALAIGELLKEARALK